MRNRRADQSRHSLVAICVIGIALLAGCSSDTLVPDEGTSNDGLIEGQEQLDEVQEELDERREELQEIEDELSDELEELEAELDSIEDELDIDINIDVD